MAEMARIEVRMEPMESIARLSMEFRARGFQMLTPDLESKVSDGLSYRRLFVCNADRIIRTFRLTGRNIYIAFAVWTKGYFVSRSVDFIRQCASFTVFGFTRFQRTTSALAGKRVYGWKTCFRIGHHHNALSHTRLLKVFGLRNKYRAYGITILMHTAGQFMRP